MCKLGAPNCCFLSAQKGTWHIYKPTRRPRLYPRSPDSVTYITGCQPNHGLSASRRESGKSWNRFYEHGVGTVYVTRPSHSNFDCFRFGSHLNSLKLVGT